MTIVLHSEPKYLDSVKISFSFPRGNLAAEFSDMDSTDQSVAGNKPQSLMDLYSLRNRTIVVTGV